MAVFTVDLAMAVFAIAIALALRPWRAIGATGPPWAWVVAWAMLPLLWSLDRQLGVAVLPTLSGAALLVLMTGWPLAVLASVPMAIVAAVCGPLDAAEALHRAVWLGIMPATAALGIGAATRRFLPHHVAVYLMGRGFIGTGIGVLLALALGVPVAGSAADGWVARLLMAMAEASLTAGIAAVLLVQRPELLATYADRLYLEPRPRST
ncbi:MAG TPA: hypothetical protein VFU71_05365 [Burkholderiaceae bacterium]|nr:hypothetical protein [Burkholderiaceae bacterium]